MHRRWEVQTGKHSSMQLGLFASRIVTKLLFSFELHTHTRLVDSASHQSGEYNLFGYGSVTAVGSHPISESPTMNVPSFVLPPCKITDEAHHILIEPQFLATYRY